MGKTETLVLDEERLQPKSDPLLNFRAIRAKRSFERSSLPFLKTVVDFDIACEVAFHQLAGSPVTVKGLLLQGLAPTITVLRRLNRLCALGIVVRTRSRTDGRVNELTLHPDVEPLFAEYGRFHGPAGR